MFLTLLVSGLVMGCIYGIIALGYSLIYKASGLMSFVQGDLMTVGSYLGLTFFAYIKLPFPIALVCVAVCMFVLGMFIERFVIRRLRKRGIKPVYVVLATIAMSYIIQNACQKIWGPQLLQFPAFLSMKSVILFGRSFQMEYIFTIGLSLIIMVILQLFMRKSRVGTSMRAAAMDQMAAKACGINVNFATGMAWALAACTAALAGVMIAPIYGVLATFGAQIGTKGFAAAVIGGYGNMYGSIIGGLLLGLVEIFTASYISSTYKDIFAYGILIIFLFVKPYGLFNEKTIKS